MSDNNFTNNTINGIIYKICFPNGKHYIGITECDIRKRQNEHKYAANTGKTQCVYNALRKYSLIETDFCELIDTAVSVEELYEKEKIYIQQYNSHYIDGYGYNMTYGGEGNHGYVYTENDRKKISESQLERFKDLEERNKLSNISRNYWNGNEYAKEQMRELKKRQCTLEWRQKQSEILKNTHKNNPDLSKQHSERMKQRFADNPNLSKQHSERMKQRFADNTKLRTETGLMVKQAYADNPELRIKCSESQKKRFEKQEEKDKLSKAQKQRFEINPNSKINKNMVCKPFIVYDKKTNEIIGLYDYKFQAVDDIKERFEIVLHTSNITKILEGNGKSTKGMIFKYR
jgi:hypothetical protein